MPQYAVMKEGNSEGWRHLDVECGDISNWLFMVIYSQLPDLIFHLKEFINKNFIDI